MADPWEHLWLIMLCIVQQGLLSIVSLRVYRLVHGAWNGGDSVVSMRMELNNTVRVDFRKLQYA